MSTAKQEVAQADQKNPETESIPNCLADEAEALRVHPNQLATEILEAWMDQRTIDLAKRLSA